MEIKNYEYEIKRIVNDTEKLKKEWFKRLDEQGGFTNELLKQAEQQDNLEENQLAENENEHVDHDQDMGDGTGYDDENDNERGDMREDENENGNPDDENGEQYDGDENDQNDPGLQENEQHQPNRPKYNSA